MEKNCRCWEKNFKNWDRFQKTVDLQLKLQGWLHWWQGLRNIFVPLQGGIYMFHLLDTYAAGISLLCSALFEAVAVSWFYGKYVLYAFILKSYLILAIHLLNGISLFFNSGKYVAIEINVVLKQFVVFPVLIQNVP